MPLVRLQVRNEFGLGGAELYRDANRDDPKAVLDGVAVAGLVGILRQLGDLADFAAEVFHGLQEQVMATASRSHRLMIRVQNIEASLPPLEKAVLAQTSHIHFAYTAGCEWHPRIKTARNHFIYNDLPPFIMDSYEECRDPPRMHLLDKFDTGGPGSCFRRYSDPTFFKKVSAVSEERYSEKTEKARKSRKSKKRRSSRRNSELLRGEQMHVNSGRMQFISSSINGRSSSQTASTVEMTMKSDLEDRSNSFDSKSGAGYIECVFHPSNSTQPDELDCEEPSSSRLTQKTETLKSSPPMDDNISHDSLEKQVASSSSGVTWDEKEEILESNSQACETDKTPERLVEKQNSDMHVNEAVSVANISYNDILFNEERNLKPVLREIQTDDIDSEPDNDNFMDALNSIESESEVDFDYETKREVQQNASHATCEMVENGGTETPNLFDNDIPDSLQENPPLVSESHASNLGSATTPNILDTEKVTRDAVYSTNESINDLPDSPQEIPHLTSEPHASDLDPASPSDDPYRKETFGNFPDTLPEIPPLASEPHESNLGCASPSDVSASKQISKSEARSHSSESPISERGPHLRDNFALDHLAGTHTSIDSPTVNNTVSTPISTDTSFSGSKLPDEKAGKINNIFKYEDTHKESFSDNSVRFWTNGGLLGLEPSKPPDFALPNSLNQGSLISSNETNGGSLGNSMQKSNGSTFKEGHESSAKVTQQLLKESSSRYDDQACTSENTSRGSQQSNGHTKSNILAEGNVTAPGTVLSAAADTKDCAETDQRNGENSSQVFGLGHRLLIKGFNRKVSFDEKSGPYSSLKSVILEQSEQNGSVRQPHPETTFKEKVSFRYPIDSLPPSPPLEHMKISFQPLSGFETSKLKLQFPDGSNHHESITDMFPSFQLVPESSIPMDDSGSHSDGDDTFCRSSPCASYDCHTTRSDYDSDQWESEETHESSDHGIHDSPHRSSSTESILSTKEHGRMSNNDADVKNDHMNRVESSLSGPLLDFPCFDNVNPVLEKESNRHHEHNNDATTHNYAEPTRPPPPPPPVPPTQWRVTKPQLDKSYEMKNSISEDAEKISDQSLPESTIFQQPRHAEVEQIQHNQDGHNESYDAVIHKLKEKLGPPKLNSQKEVNQLRMGHETDEREDFLYQIRTKSFNLRPTVTGKSNTSTGPTANVQVTAILEKANAIRQVVTSDEGEDDDDNWSDT
ncbi:unnamed protein product [Vicia faba]|uniref:Protein SCAR n=1 Tax=Vicia faba TaxID=3906 RepID=A0AAV1B8D0_VICFA|nr:unnamed protein product [Vicia faba]